jgi:MTH538 TIR-like domain (DUF1863)
MPFLRTYRVFISHAWDYSADYWRVVQFLNEAPRFRWENLSVPEHDPVNSLELEYQLRNQMRPADVFLIIAGMYAARREWIDFELRFARRIGRPVIGIMKWDSIQVPTAIQNDATELVGWNGASIVRAIRAQALPSGEYKLVI